MAAAYLKIVLERGVDWDLPLTWKNPDETPVDVTGYSAKMEIREGTVDVPGEVALTLSTVNGKVVLDGNNDPNITLSLTAADTTTLAAGSDYCYDLQLTDGSGRQRRLLRGDCDVQEEVTQP
jgi:hypothetical protein